MKKIVLAMAAAALVVPTIVAAAPPVDSFYASSERFGYTGTVSVYNTLADAALRTNAVCETQQIPQRDGGIFAVKGYSDYWIDSNDILTNWWANNGASPSDTNFGFFQLADENADTWKTQKGTWSKDLNKFTVRATGKNATYGSSSDPKDYARLWNACAPQGSGETTIGTFLTYTYVLTATGLAGVEDPNEPGFIKNTENASDYSGHFNGIFLNQSTTSTLSNRYYVFNIEFNNISWAAKHNCGYGGTTTEITTEEQQCNDDNPAWDDEFGGKK